METTQNMALIKVSKERVKTHALSFVKTRKVFYPFRPCISGAHYVNLIVDTYQCYGQQLAPYYNYFDFQTCNKYEETRGRVAECIYSSDVVIIRLLLSLINSKISTHFAISLLFWLFQTFFYCSLYTLIKAFNCVKHSALRQFCVKFHASFL